MYVHRRCVLERQEIDYKKKAHGYCGVCGNQGTIYHVIGTLDHYLYKRQGVTYSVTGGEKEPVNVTEALSYNEIAPVEMPADVELVEVNEAVEEATDSLLGPILDEVIEEEKRPKETPVEAKPESMTATEFEGKTNEQVKAVTEALTADGVDMSLEAEPEPIIETGRLPLDLGPLPDGPVISKAEEPKGIDEELAEVEEQLQKESPEEMAQDAESEPIAEEVVAESPEAVVEAVSEPSIERAYPVPKMSKEEMAAELAKAKKAEIARLEAELEALRN